MTPKSLFAGRNGASAADNLATAFGVKPDQAQLAMDYMTQALTDRIERNTLSRGGIADIFDLLARPGTGTALRDSTALASNNVADAGNQVLEVLFGTKHQSRGIAAGAARTSGIDVDTLQRMLPAVASMVMGALQQRAMPKIEKSLAAVSGSPLPLPGEPRAAPRPQAPDYFPPASPPAPAPSSAPSPAPSTPGGGTTGQMPPQRPLPIPGDDVGSADGPSRFPQIPDVIRRGDRRIEVPDSGGSTGSLDNVIRDILANVLGFKNTGILGFIVKLLLSRWFLGLVGRILRGVLGQRR